MKNYDQTQYSLPVMALELKPSLCIIVRRKEMRCPRLFYSCQNAPNESVQDRFFSKYLLLNNNKPNIFFKYTLNSRTKKPLIPGQKLMWLSNSNFGLFYAFLLGSCLVANFVPLGETRVESEI